MSVQPAAWHVRNHQTRFAYQNEHCVRWTSFTDKSTSYGMNNSHSSITTDS